MKKVPIENSYTKQKAPLKFYRQKIFSFALISNKCFYKVCFLLYQKKCSVFINVTTILWTGLFLYKEKKTFAYPLMDKNSFLLYLTLYLPILFAKFWIKLDEIGY